MRDRHGLPCVRDFEGMELPRIAALAIAPPLPPAPRGGEGRLSSRACMAALAAFAGTLIHPHPVAQYQLLAEVSRDLP